MTDKTVVLLCNPPSPPDAVADREAAYGMGALRAPGAATLPPHTLAWCGATLRQAGWEPRALDAVAERLSVAAALERIARQAPALLILLASPQSADADEPFVRAVRSRFPALPLLLVGLATAFLPPALVRLAGTRLVGEPEGAVAEAVRALLAGETTGTLSPQRLGVVGYDGRGQLLDLNALPPPAWDLFPVRCYAVLPIVASRGCGRGCRPCPVPLTQGRARRSRLPVRVASEMRLLHLRFGVRRFHFLDPLFTADASYVEALCAALQRRRLPRWVRWSCEAHPAQVALPLLRLLAQSGCHALHLGLESVSPDTLVAIRRVADAAAVPAYLAAVRHAILGCRAFGIECHLHVQGGLPGNRSAAQATKTFLRAYPPSHIQVRGLVPYPGTAIVPSRYWEAEVALLRELALAPPEPRSPLAPWRRWFGRQSRLPSA